MELTKTVAVLLIFAFTYSTDASPFLERVFGNVNYTRIGQAVAAELFPYAPTTKTITFPADCPIYGKHIIKGIKQIEHGLDFPEIDIIIGGFEKNYVQFTVTMQKIQAFYSLFEFYGEAIPDNHKIINKNKAQLK